MILSSIVGIPKIFFRAIEIKFWKKQGRVLPLYFINFLITYHCNARCSMCSIWQKYKKDPRQGNNELTLEEIKKFLKENKNYLRNLKHIGITGGEAFLREDIVEIVKAIKEILPWVETGIQTNGLSPQFVLEKTEKILKFYPNFSLSVSIDGLGETHDKVRGIPKAFDKAVKTIKGVQELGVKNISCGMTISSKNYKQILKTQKYVEDKLNCRFTCFLSDESDYYFDNIGKNQILDKKQTAAVIRQLKNYEGGYYLDNLRQMMEKGKRRTLPCYSGYTSIVIDPFGEVMPCVLKSWKFGNIKTQRLKEMMSSQNAIQIRKKIDGCICFSQCEVSSSAVVDVFDVLRWFLTSSLSGKKQFLTSLLKEKKQFLEG